MKSKTKTVNVKIEKPKGMSTLEAESLLVKALTGSSHDHKEKFEEPANQELFDLMNKTHELVIEESLSEILKIIDDRG